MRNFLILILLTMTLTGCSNGDGEKISKNRETLVYGTNNNISVLIDNNWKIYQSKEYELFLTGKNKHEIIIKIEDINNSFDKKTDGVIDQFRDKEEFSLNSKSEIIVDSIPSLFVSLELLENDEKVTYNFYLIPMDSKMMNIEVRAPSSYFDEVFVEDLLDTLTIIKKENIKKRIKITERPLFLRRKILEGIKGYSTITSLNDNVISNLVKTYQKLTDLDEEFRKTKEFSIFNKRNKNEADKILKKNGFKNIRDFENRIDKSIASLMVINYSSEFKDKISEVEKNLVSEIIRRNSLSLNDIKAVYSNYRAVNRLEKRMRLQ